jgi:hypothetical protein
MSLACALLLAAPASATKLEPTQEAIDAITAAGLRRHMEVLAADDMEGRAAGTAGFDRAARYVADFFREHGIAPLASSERSSAENYFQRIEFFESRLIPESAAMTFVRAGERVQLQLREDFVCNAGFGAPTDSIAAPLVFVGHGIVAPEYQHDDYAGIDVTGKIVVVLSGAPPGFATDLRAFYSSLVEKMTLAVRGGAVGFVTVRTPVDEKRQPWDRLLPGVGEPAMRWLDRNGKPSDAFPELAAVATLNRPAAARLFALAGRDLEATFEAHASGKTGSFEMGVGAELRRRSGQRRTWSHNVVGVLRGSDPVLRDEYVVLTAHLDHLGLRPSDDGDTNHNGAYDNAAGVSAILEVAAAMASSPQPPRRSILFVALTAEEMGLRGSSYFAVHSPVPIDRIVANINIDMPYLGFPIADIEAFGAEHSTLLAPLQEATSRLGLALTPDTMPEQVRFIRSDQFSFVKKGIPAVAFKPGQKSSDPSIDGAAMLADFLKNHYHQSSDELDLPFSEVGAQRYLRAAFVLATLVANRDERPRWNDGDFFGDKFGR